MTDVRSKRWIWHHLEVPSYAFRHQSATSSGALICLYILCCELGFLLAVASVSLFYGTCVYPASHRMHKCHIQGEVLYMYAGVEA